MAVTLAQFVEDRLDEIEAVALACIDTNIRAEMKRGVRPGPRRWVAVGSSIYDQTPDVGRGGTLRVRHTWEREAAHIIRHDPARVLAEVAAKRRTLARHADCGEHFGYCGDGGHGFEFDNDGGHGCADLADLAAPDHEHPDYNPAWRNHE